MRVTDIPTACWHNVGSRCAVERHSSDVIGPGVLSCDFSTCWKQPRDALVPTEDDDGGGGCLGYVYYSRMCELIDRQLELGTADRVCYVGDAKSARIVASMLTERYCLVHPVVIVDESAAATGNVADEVRSPLSSFVSFI